MRRREFIAGAAGAAMSFAHPVFAQSAASPGIKRIAIFHPTEDPEGLSFKTRGAYSAFLFS